MYKIRKHQKQIRKALLGKSYRVPKSGKGQCSLLLGKQGRDERSGDPQHFPDFSPPILPSKFHKEKPFWQAL